jgi:hypothetical protein
MDGSSGIRRAGISTEVLTHTHDDGEEFPGGDGFGRSPVVCDRGCTLRDPQTVPSCGPGRRAYFLFFIFQRPLAGVRPCAVTFAATGLSEALRVWPLLQKLPYVAALDLICFDLVFLPAGRQEPGGGGGRGG